MRDNLKINIDRRRRRRIPPSPTSLLVLLLLLLLLFVAVALGRVLSMPRLSVFLSVCCAVLMLWGERIEERTSFIIHVCKL
jgi:hypothetical protein